MGKLTEYVRAHSFDDNDILIKDGINGTKKITIEDALKYVFAMLGDASLGNSKKFAVAQVVGDAIDRLQKSSEDQFDDIVASLGDKIDGAYVQDGYLYMTSDGEVVVGPLGPFSGGGGGGSGGNNAVIAVANETGWLSKTINKGADCYIKIDWSSTEDDIPTGNGVMTIRVNNVPKRTLDIPQGVVSVNLKDILGSGTNKVRVSVADVYDNTRTLNFTVKAIELRLTSSFDASINYSSNYPISYTYVPYGSLEKTTHFILDGVEIGTQVVTASDRPQEYKIPAMSHGSHSFEVYYTAEIDGETVESDHLTYELMIIDEESVTPVISSDFKMTSGTQYQTLAIPYRVYTPGSLSSAVELYANDELVSEVTVDRTEQVWSYRLDEVGSLKLTIKSGTTVLDFQITVEDSGIDVEAETEALSLYLTSYGRSNNEAHPEVWKDEDNNIECQLANFDFVTNGWIADKEGATALRVSGDARVTIPFRLFQNDFRTTGKTIEIEFATRDVLDYDAILISCMNGGRGIQLTSQRATLASEQTTISTQYKEDEHVRISFVAEKRSEDRLLAIYINGIMSGVVQYPDDDDFSQQTPVDISIGSNGCTTDIYCIRVYNNNLTRFQIVSNWIADTHDINTMIERYEHNDVYDEYGKVVIDKLPHDLPYMILNAPELPQYKGDKKTITGSYTDLVHPEKSFAFEGCQINVQGTSSAPYARKNYDMQFKSGFEMSGGTHADNFELASGIVPFNRFVVKADVASSESANNVELVKLFCDVDPYKRPEELENTKVRKGIYGFPIVIFWHNTDDDSITMLGKYNFNLPKRAPGPYGYSGDMESWEFQNNTSNLMLFLSDYFSEAPQADPDTGEVKAAWRYDYEARFPSDEWIDYSKLQEFQSFVFSTYRAGATGAELANPVTYTETRIVYDEVVNPETGAVDYVERLVTEDVTYTTDTTEYRLSKFHHEFGKYAEVDSFIFYYLFTELFLMVDSRAKNLFIGFSGGPTTGLTHIDRKAVAEPYDMDTALGTNNEGSLVFDYGLEDTDHLAGGADVFNGQNSVLWCNLRDAFGSEIAQMYKSLRSSGVLSYATVSARFTEHQAKWPEAIFNEDAQFKYLDPLVNPDPGKEPTAVYLPMLQGSKAEQRKWWLYNRFHYMDSKWNAGDALDEAIQLRGYAKADIIVTPYADIYPTVKYGSYPVQKRGKHGVPTVIECPLDNINDTEIYIYSASQIESVGDLSGLKVGFADFSKATKLKSIKVGSEASGYTNGNLETLNVGQNSMLGTVDARNCINLTGGVDLSGAANIEHAYFDGTKITSCALPVGGIVKTLHLPGTVTNLTVRNQPLITDFSMPSYANITTLRIENSPAIPVNDILEAIPANSRVRLIGFNAVMNSASEVEEFYDFLDTMRGLDEAGNNTDKAVVSGTISGLGSIDGAWLAQMQARYPSIVIEGNVSSTLRYFNYDGTILIDSETVAENGDGQKAATLYPTGTQDRQDDAQYDYTFLGWNREKNATVADPNATKNIRGDRNVYAAYSAVVNKYTVTWLDQDDSVLETQSVEYGTVPSRTLPDGALGWDPEPHAVDGPQSYKAMYGYRVRYYNYNNVILEQYDDVPPGETREFQGTNPSRDGYIFLGWEPEVGPVNSNVDYYPKFERLYAVRFYNDAAMTELIGEPVMVRAGTSIDDIIRDHAPSPTPSAAYKVFDSWSYEDEDHLIDRDTNIIATYYDIYTVEFYNDPTAMSAGTRLGVLNNLRVGTDAASQYIEGGGTAPSMDQKDFSGRWDPDVSNIQPRLDPDGDHVIKCVAVYNDKHRVRFINVDTDHILDTIYVSNGATVDGYSGAIEHPYNPSRLFPSGWTPDLNSTPITQDTDFYVLYPESYTVRFYLNEDKSDTPETVTYVANGDDAVYPAEGPSKTGYRFNGWVPSNRGITSNRDCVAQWVAVYEVTFMNQSGTGNALATVTVDSGSSAEYPSTAPTPTNADSTTFLGWAGSANQNAAVDNILDNITANKTVYAAHNPAYNVVFKNMDDSTYETMRVEKGTDAVPTKGNPTHPHNAALAFTGWSPSNLNIQADTTCVAQYETSYTVLFKNGNTTVQTFSYVKSGSSVTFSGTAPTNTDNTTWLGWSETNGATVAEIGKNDSVTVTADKTYYAVFNPAYTVTFMNQSGTGNALQTKKVEKGGTASYTGSTPSNADSSGFSTDFLGWADTANATAVTAGVLENIQANKTVYAAHKAWYTVTFMNGSTMLTSKKVQTGGTVTYDGTEPTGDGDFLGWAAVNGASSADPDILKNITENKTVYAVFASSWKNVLAAIDDGSYKTKYNVGDTIPMTLSNGQKLNMQIVAMNEDDMADGSGKAPMTFIAVEQLEDTHVMNDPATTAGGYAVTSMRQYLTETVLPMIPDDIRAQIKPVTKRTWYYNGDVNTLSTEEIWIPSEYEVGGTGRETEGATYASVFTNAASRIKKRAGIADPWWVRSAGRSTSFHHVFNDGDFGDNSAANSYGVVLGFCLGASVGTKEITDSWSEIFAAQDDNTYNTKYALGDTKTMYLDGEPVRMQIVAFNEDDLADNSGKAKITWIAKDVLLNAQKMNTTNKTSGGYAATAMRSYLVNTLKPLIPSTILGGIKSVTKHTKYYNVTGDTLTSEDVWIPSSYEMGNSGYETAGAKYTAFFTSAASRIKKKVGTANFWWLRSAHDSANFRGVSNNGSFDYYNASANTIGVVLGFCTGALTAFDDTEITDDWDTILAAIDNGTYKTKYKIGNYKPLNLDTEGTINMQIVAMNEDDMADGSGKAPVTMIAKELLTTTYKMNENNTTRNGYAATFMRTYLRSTIRNLIPENVRAQIKPVTKRTRDYSTNTDTVSSEDIWIPSSYEVGISGFEATGAKYTKVFNNAASRIKTREGTANNWWLRTSSNSSYFLYVSDNGGSTGAEANTNRGVALGFCLGAATETGQISDSWSEILAAEADGTYSTKYALGDTKVMYLNGDPMRMQIVAFNADELADESGNKAPISWISKELLKTSHRMNATNTTNGGWGSSEMRAYLAETIKPLIPSEIQNVIKTVKKYTNSYENGNKVYDIETKDDMWIPSGREANPSAYLPETLGPKYATIFPNKTSLIKHKIGSSSPSNWWLRSPADGQTFTAINTSGSGMQASASGSNAIALGFCT